MEGLYSYKAKIVSVYDGDTVTAEVDLGFNVKITEKLRLYGINAPEMRGADREKGKASRDALRSQVLNRVVLVNTIRDKKGKYGRYLAVLYLPEHHPLSVNEWLIDNEYAVEANY